MWFNFLDDAEAMPDKPRNAFAWHPQPERRRWTQTQRFSFAFWWWNESYASKGTRVRRKMGTTLTERRYRLPCCSWGNRPDMGIADQHKTEHSYARSEHNLVDLLFVATFRMSSLLIMSSQSPTILKSLMRHRAFTVRAERRKGNGLENNVI